MVVKMKYALVKGEITMLFGFEVISVTYTYYNSPPTPENV